MLHHRRDFPGLVTYDRVVTLIPRVGLPLFALLLSLCGGCTGTSFVDSTVLRVCHIKRAPRNRVFKGLAGKAKSSMGWFFGFKLHLVINEVGELLAFRLTPGNVDDRTPVKQGIKLVTPLCKNMKSGLMLMEEKLLLRKRALIEIVNDHLKNVC